jgi:hypothetical protein
MSQNDWEPQKQFKYLKNQILTSSTGKVLIKIINTMDFPSGGLYCAQILKHWKPDWVGDFRDYHSLYIEKNFTKIPSSSEIWKDLNT